ncbi:MAG TPA: response regulator, partial [Magnetococcales bacterium]|nr:response regulator [Magnetococcales bacterium]
MYKILIVEDSRLFSNLLKKEVLSREGLSPVVTESFAATKKILEAGQENFFVALLDINLPDAPQGEVVDLVLGHGVPAIVFTGEFNDELRERMITKKVVDYILKENASSVTQVVSLVERLIRNQSIKVLVVDDSRSARLMVVDLLKIHRFNVLEAADGDQAMEVLVHNPDIRLVLTDYNMPGMDGFELTQQIRKTYDKSQIAVIGLSSYGNNILSARFLKRGANDFITKPFLAEEFFVRVTQNVEIIEYISAL